MVTLHYAAEVGNIRLITELLEDGYPIDGQDEHGQTPLHCATRTGQVDAVKFLLDHKAQPDIPENGGETTLHYAVIFNNTQTKKIISLLLNNGANYTIRDSKNWTPLSLARALHKDLATWFEEYVITIVT